MLQKFIILPRLKHFVDITTVNKTESAGSPDIILYNNCTFIKCGL